MTTAPNDNDPAGSQEELLRYTASLITQGNHRFHTFTVPSDVLARTCTVDTREEDPFEGFQRKLDRKRAEEIARYIDEGFGTIPCSIVLSAQDRASFLYGRKTRTVTFKDVNGAFLILDGQHRVFGFALAKSQLRVPVVVYSHLTRAQECRLFIDINTKQRPVPNELLLDIKRLAETESSEEEFFGSVFDRFNEDSSSPLFGLLSPAARVKGKLSRVTFYSALRSTGSALGADSDRAYAVLSAYFQSVLSGLRRAKADHQITNATLFRAFALLFVDVAQRVADRRNGSYSVDDFDSVLTSLFDRLKSSQLRSPGTSHVELHEVFQDSLRRQFSIGG